MIIYPEIWGVKNRGTATSTKKCFQAFSASTKQQVLAQRSLYHICSIVPTHLTKLIMTCELNFPQNLIINISQGKKESKKSREVKVPQQATRLQQSRSAEPLQIEK
jgi:hypothetical protein